MSCDQRDYICIERQDRKVGEKENTAVRLLCQTNDCPLDVGKNVDRKTNRFERERFCKRLNHTSIEDRVWVVGIVNHTNASDVRRDLLQNFQHLPEHREFKHGEASEVASWSRETLNPTCANRINRSGVD